MNENDTQLNLPEREEHILKLWEENQIFEHTLSKTKKGKPFVFYEGPPFANGHPGIHHIEARSFKDVILRFKTMQGRFVSRRAGWDTHGLPVELQVEKELGLKNKRDIERYGIASFNQKCRESVWIYKKEWEEMTKRMGYWLDFKNAYITYDNRYMETLWAILKRYADVGALYQDYKIIPWCSRCGTGLSSHELGQPGAYREIKDPSVFVKFKIRGKDNESLLVWTTTPWTLSGNVAVAVNPKIEYTKFRVGREIFWSAKTPPIADSLQAEVLDKTTGKALLGVEYEPPYRDMKKKIPYKVLGGDFVDSEEGTGFVHLAPAFGEDDMAAVKKEYGEYYPILLTVNEEGKMMKGVVGEGLFAKEADKAIIEDLKKRNLLFKILPYAHEYPHCWRCDTPLLYMARKSWWVRKPVEGLIKENKKINWVPEYLKDGRFGEWIKEKKDWAFSRERYWGTPLPIWQCESCKNIETIGSIEELSKKTTKSGNSYMMLRHGEAEHNLFGTLDATLDAIKLTEKGRKQVLAAAKKLKKEKFDIIVSSDILRAKETAGIVSQITGVMDIVYDSRIREIHLGMNGKPAKLYHKLFPTYEDKFEKRPVGGESLRDVRARMVGFIKDIDEKYAKKKILIIGHEYPLWMLWTAGQGMNEEQAIKVKEEKKGWEFIKNAEAMKFPYRKLPYSHTGEVDLHRPYIDEISLSCASCKGAMKRVPEVCDVWFDSGAMPFAQAHWPFDRGSAKKQPKVFPADFICEGVDQTRGWFYTLLTTSTLLGFPASYKNVLSVGIVLDKNGQKMSKSKGNIVRPEEIIQKYGIDSLRWYFYTINSPNDSKLFDEKDVMNRMRGYLSTLWNSFILFDTYNKKEKRLKLNKKSSHILDRWVLSRLHALIGDTTEKLNAFDIVGAARGIEEFTINDFSNWYLRRSRKRFQKPKSEKEKKEAAETAYSVLLSLVSLSAPFTPFLSEMIYRRLREKSGMKELSVHLLPWPKVDKKFSDRKLEEGMAHTRTVTALALQERSKAGIKVRQPLASLSVKTASIKDKGLLAILQEEVNVKRVIADTKIEGEVMLDTHITPELKEEGLVREIIRNIQEMRKDGGMKPGDKIYVQILPSQKMERMLEKWTSYIKDGVDAKIVRFGGKKEFSVERDSTIDGETVWIGIVKV